MENIHVMMILENVTHLPEFQLPSGYIIRKYQEGDKRIWAEVETAAGEFPNPLKGLEQFEKEFIKYPEELKERLLFLENSHHQCIGTAMGWFDDSYFKPGYGRIHWVGIHPDFQGKGLAKPLVGEALKIISKFHDKVYLTTQTRSFKAIKIYLDFGFKPFVRNKTCPVAWKMMADLLKHPALDDFR
jgi:ribosomal protein S18 acetylase RimI-like enzyme